MWTKLIDTAQKTLGYTPYKEQIQGAKALSQGKLIEMKTGEGKTLTAVFPAAIHALSGGKVHILTFNDYLAKRDAQWMGPFYQALGLSVAYLTPGMTTEQRRNSYACDIVYATAKEVGFDYLRSFIAYQKDDIILPQLDFAIVDEADAILIDEARNPLVLAADMDQDYPDLKRINRIIADLERKEDVELDEYGRNVFLTESGSDKVEKLLGLENLYEEKNRWIHSAINLSLHAHYLLEKDRDYVIKDRELKLVDEFTGRIVKDRKWQHGLQIAVETKEGLCPQYEGLMMGTVTLPAFLKKYSKLAGMTATASESKDEFRKLYQLEICQIPSHLPCIRLDLPDQIFSHKEAKEIALIQEITKIHTSGRPILIGTLTVKESEDLAQKLRLAQLNPKVLNASNDEQEAAIIAEAGDLFALTISTNMAGRGTDIVLGGQNGNNREAVLNLGGLHVIGTNRHESRRIDNQLRGRSGRQGDPGSSQFFISMEDDLMIKYNLKSLLPKKRKEIEAVGLLRDSVIAKRIAQAQRIIEGQMQELRKTLSDYTAIIEQQREIFQSERQTWLNAPDSIRVSILNNYDLRWAEFLDYALEVKEGIYLLRLGGESPLRKFNKTMDGKFRQMMLENEQTIEAIEKDPEAYQKAFPSRKPGSTWNYVVNDSPFQNQFIINLLAGSLMGTART